MSGDLIAGVAGWLGGFLTLVAVLGGIALGWREVHRECWRCGAHYYGPHGRWPVWIMGHQCGGTR